jgi:hypothetical protein
VAELPHYCRWVLRRPATTLAVPLVLALALSACGGSSTSTTASSGSATSPGPTSAPASPTSPPPATGGPPSPPQSPGGGSGGDGGGSGSAFLEVTRSGGIAGVRDVVRVAADGTGKMLNRQGGQRTCRPPAAAVNRLRRMDLAAVAALPSPTGVVNDGFVFSVRSPAGAATVGQGDKNGRRADLLSAAAAVISSCVVGLPGPGTTMR